MAVAHIYKAQCGLESHVSFSLLPRVLRKTLPHTYTHKEHRHTYIQSLAKVAVGSLFTALFFLLHHLTFFFYRITHVKTLFISPLTLFLWLLHLIETHKLPTAKEVYNHALLLHYGQVNNLKKERRLHLASSESLFQLTFCRSTTDAT